MKEVLNDFKTEEPQQSIIEIIESCNKALEFQRELTIELNKIVCRLDNSTLPDILPKDKDITCTLDLLLNTESKIEINNIHFQKLIGKLNRIIG